MTERTVTGAGLALDNVVAQAAERLILAASSRVRTAPVRDVTIQLEKNGEPASSGSGTACLGDPLNAPGPLR